MAYVFNNCDLNILVAMGNQTTDEYKRKNIKLAIVNIISEKELSLFELSNKFLVSRGILRECLADVIVKELLGNFVELSGEIMDEVISCTSTDILRIYGNRVISRDFREKCQFETRIIEKNADDRQFLYRKVSRLNKYSIGALVALSRQVVDEELLEEIKLNIIHKIFDRKLSLFELFNKFLVANGF